MYNVLCNFSSFVWCVCKGSHLVDRPACLFGVGFKMVHFNTKKAKVRACQSQVCYLQLIPLALKLF